MIDWRPGPEVCNLRKDCHRRSRWEPEKYLLIQAPDVFLSSFHLDGPNKSIVANGSADNGLNRFSVNLVGCPGLTLTST